MLDEKVDVLEDYLLLYSKKLLKILLEDKTTDKNIIWAIDDYHEEYGFGFEPENCITTRLITGLYGEVIQPRSKKNIETQNYRTRNKAEVFTPSWICNKQNNLIDNAWFEKENVFNIEEGTAWITNKEKIDFKSIGKSWKDYVNLNRLEVTCGEAPYLVSRYDSVLGNIIPVEDRIGLLDRKLRVVCENTTTKEDWKKWSLKAIKSVYAYDYQGDNVLIARENVLYTYIDFYKSFFNTEPNEKEILAVAKVVAWNIWQMDGLTYMPPLINLYKSDERLKESNQQYCKMKDWSKNKILTFKSLLEQ